MNFDIDFAIKTFFIVIKAIPVTLKIVIFPFCIAFIPALIIAILRIKKVKVVIAISEFFISVNRGFPVVVQILFIYSFVPMLLNSIFTITGVKINIYDLNPIVYAYIVFTMQFIALLSEIFRSALQTVSKNQYEAGLCAGLSSLQTYTRIILPQAFVSATPNICNTVVGILKATSLVYYMTIKDITGTAMNAASIGFNYIEAYLDVFVVYVILCSVIQFLFRKLEAYLNVTRNGGVKLKKRRLYARN